MGSEEEEERKLKRVRTAKGVNSQTKEGVVPPPSNTDLYFSYLCSSTGTSNQLETHFWFTSDKGMLSSSIKAQGGHWRESRHRKSELLFGGGRRGRGGRLRREGRISFSGLFYHLPPPDTSAFNNRLNLGLNPFLAFQQIQLRQAGIY